MKKSQIQMVETVMVLLLFFALLVLGFIFYTGVIKTTTKGQIEENLQLESISLAQKATFLPELQCSEKNIVTENCIDLLKLTSSSIIMLSNPVYYYDIFGYSTIQAQEIYPIPKSFLLYNRTPEDFKNKIASFVPTTFYDPETKSYAFGVMVIEKYTQ